MHTSFRFATFQFVLLLALHGGAQGSPLQTDRPGNGNAATVVSAGTFQVETSVNYSYDNQNSDVHAVGLPTGLRLGLIDGLEFRVNTDFFSIARQAGQTEAGAVDTAFGVKLRAFEQSGFRPNLALQAQLTFPTGRARFSSGSVMPQALILAGWNLTDQLYLLTNTGVESASLNQQTTARVIYFGGLTQTLGLISDRLSVFVEGFGKVATRSQDTSIHQFDTGLVYLINDDMQLDLFVQFGLTDASPDNQTALGYSIRFE